MAEQATPGRRRGGLGLAAAGVAVGVAIAVWQVVALGAIDREDAIWDAPTSAERFKDAAGVALIALLLGIPMIGLTTADQGGSLQVLTRWPLLAAFIAASFCGRLAVRYLLDTLKERRQSRDRQATAATRCAFALPRRKGPSARGYTSAGHFGSLCRPMCQARSMEASSGET